MTLLTHNERIILRRLDKASKDTPAPLSDGFENTYVDTVYWMPLPELPKEEEV